MENNKMIMDDVMSTKVSDADIANAVANNNMVNGSSKKIEFPRKTYTVIRKFDKKVMPNDPCPCGSGKKYKKCCKGNGDFEGTRELSKSEMADVRFNNMILSKFKEHI